MYPDVVDLISDSESESRSVNGDSNSIAEIEEDEVEVVTTKADELRESLRNTGWIEIDAHSIKDSIYKLYACNGDVWNDRSKTKRSGKVAG